jgi:anti-sigma factor RsiW
MSHLGELLTAFLDGELTGAEQDRVTAHLVRCERCRTEAASLRELKERLRSLTGVPADTGAELAKRLLALPDTASRTVGSSATARVRRRARRQDRTQRRPGGSRRPQGKTRLTKRRYVVLGTVSVVVGLGAAAFSVGGADTGSGPRITPQVELYSEEHAITTGEVPFTGPAAEMAGLPAKPDRAGKTGPTGNTTRTGKASRQP